MCSCTGDYSCLKLGTCLRSLLNEGFSDRRVPFVSGSSTCLSKAVYGPRKEGALLVGWIHNIITAASGI